MASIGHIVVGLAAARAHDNRTECSRRDAGLPPRPTRLRVVAAVAFAQLALLPDLDVIAFRLGIPYEEAFGHRGASHSLFVAAVFGAAAAWPLARGLSAGYIATGIAAIVALGSHGLLDMLTDGGHGAAVLWPFSERRFFFPIQPLPVSPLGLGFISLRGMYCFLFEAAFFSPLIVYALGRSPLKRLERRFGARSP